MIHVPVDARSDHYINGLFEQRCQEHEQFSARLGTQP